MNSASQLVAAQVTADSSFAVDQREVLFPLGGYLRGNGIQLYDVRPDDQRFVMLGTEGEERLILVQNWFKELKRLVPN